MMNEEIHIVLKERFQARERFGLLVVYDEPEGIVLDEEGVTKGFEAEGLREAVYRVLIHQ